MLKHLFQVLAGGVVDRQITDLRGNSIPEGTPFEVISFSSPQGRNLQLLINGGVHSFAQEMIDRFTFSYDEGSIEGFWTIKALEGGALESLVKNGRQLDLRDEIDQEVIEYIRYLDINEFLLKDAYVESYLNQLIYKTFPAKPIGSRPGNLNVHVIKESIPNAFVFSNGTICLTTGLLSWIDSEEELLAVLAHEVAHFVMDHSIQNINVEAQRQQRAEFWAGLLTVAAAAVDIYATTQNEYHIPGALTMGTAVLSYTVASEVVNRMGMAYSFKQEREADKIAQELLNLLNIDSGALATALSKLGTYHRSKGNYAALAGGRTHPNLMDRIKAAGEVQTFSGQKYNEVISAINTYSAALAFYERDFHRAFFLAERNVAAGVATEEDFLLQAMVLNFTSDTDEANNLALSLIENAKQLNVYPLDEIYKQEAIILLRLNRSADARKSLSIYQSHIQNRVKGLVNVPGDRMWHAYNDYYQKELEWTAKMLYKVRDR